jgi:hypothetical protein
MAENLLVSHGSYGVSWTDTKGKTVTYIVVALQAQVLLMVVPLCLCTAIGIFRPVEGFVKVF